MRFVKFGNYVNFMILYELSNTEMSEILSRSVKVNLVGPGHGARARMDIF